MFTCNLNPNSRTTLTEQLYTALRGDMERGQASARATHALQA